MNRNTKLEDRMTQVAEYAEGKILVGKIGHVGVLLFNSPEKRNAISVEMWAGICDGLDLLANDGDVRVVVYSGTGGKAFTSGNDISQFAKLRGDADANAKFTLITGRGRNKLASFPKPSIACIEGYCLGGGLGIALQADLRVASTDSLFGITAAKIGLAYAFAPMEKLVQLVGPSHARMIVYTGGKFTADQALTMGLIDIATQSEEVVDECLKLASGIADNAPLTVLAAKHSIEQLLKPPADRDMAAVEEHVRQCMDSQDYKEGRTAFMEKRKPIFEGK